MKPITATIDSADLPEKAHVVLYISLGQKYHQNGRFEATIAELDRLARSGKVSHVTFKVADTLQRYSVKMDSKDTPETVIKFSQVSLGNAWIKEKKDLFTQRPDLKSFADPKFYSFVTWDQSIYSNTIDAGELVYTPDFKQALDDDFKQALDDVQLKYNNKTWIKELIDQLTSNYVTAHLNKRYPVPKMKTPQAEETNADDSYKVAFENRGKYKEDVSRLTQAYIFEELAEFIAYNRKNNQNHDSQKAHAIYYPTEDNKPTLSEHSIGVIRAATAILNDGAPTSTLTPVIPIYPIKIVNKNPNPGQARSEKSKKTSSPTKVMPETSKAANKSPTFFSPAAEIQQGDEVQIIHKLHEMTTQLLFLSKRTTSDSLNHVTRPKPRA